MVRLNLQLFAYTGSSIVDYLKSVGKDSSYSARSQLASQYGISNYSGTASQNTQLLNMLRSGSNPSNNGTSSNTSTISSGVKLNGVDQSVVDKMNSQFQTSTAYQDAMKQTQELLDKISSGKTSYTDQIKDLMGQIQNRDKFEYDVDSDVLFQQYLSSMMKSGQTAMQDTMGQAAMLTGGYGSSYSQSVGNQAYNQYIQDAYANLPEYYELAMQAYMMEGEEMYQQLAMLSDADAQEYERLYTAYGVNNDYANTLYGQEYQKWADEVANATNLAGLQNSDYWANQNFIESQRQYNESLALQKSQFAQEMSYKQQALKQDNDQFYASLSASKTSKSGSDIKQPTEAQMKKALEAYNSGGDAALNKYVDSLGSNIDMTSIANYVDQYGELPLAQRTFTVIDDGGINWGIGKNNVDNNAKVKDQYGNTYKLSEIKKTDQALAVALSKLSKGQSYTGK